MSPEDLELVKALLATGGTIGVAVVGLIGVLISSRKPSKTKPPTGDIGNALDNFSGNQNEFMSLVIADNKALRNSMASLKSEVSKAVEDVGSIKRHQETFLGAVRRYLMKLATAWSGPEPMPWPDEEDLLILEKTLPNLGRED